MKRYKQRDECDREFYLEQICEWKSGAKATAGRPATGERYAREMREEIKRLEALLDALPVSPVYPRFDQTFPEEN